MNLIDENTVEGFEFSARDAKGELYDLIANFEFELRSPAKHARPFSGDLIIVPTNITSIRLNSGLRDGMTDEEREVICDEFCVALRREVEDSSKIFDELAEQGYTTDEPAYRGEPVAI